MKDQTDITLLLDRTGSMLGIVDEVVGGVNGFVELQKDAGDVVYTLVQFDSLDNQEVVHDAVPIDEVPLMTPETYIPRALTPLYDALGLAIARTGERLKQLAEGERPERIVFVVFTDGHENASTEYRVSAVRDMVEAQHEEYGWEFVFLGADIDAFGEAGSMGVARGTTANLARENVRSALVHTGVNVMAYATGGDRDFLSFSDHQREELGKLSRKTREQEKEL